MSDVIQLLPDSVANQIAAGEVIQRPASVIKELVENSVDAGATQIRIILTDAGKTLIQVVDNGCGMSDTDARLAFERHATSKIRKAADLFELHTMGFRGEALPSIAAVAQIDLRTMRRDCQIGSHLEIAASKFVSQTPEACAPGSNLAVKNLFFNFPARRKFLKKDAVELGHINKEFERLALVNPGIEFELIHNNVTLYQLLPGTFRQRIAGLFGKAIDKQLIPVETETPLVKISGFVCLPEFARKRNAQQFFFVNGRNMRHPYFHKAVMTCYEELISSEHQPNYFLDFIVDPQTIDVNIHPTKSEIKFENEQPIWQILSAAIREALGKFNAVPSLDFNQEDAPEIPVFNPEMSTGFEIPLDNSYNPFDVSSKKDNAAEGGIIPSSVNISAREYPSSLNRGARFDNWDKLYDDFRKATQPADEFPTIESFMTADASSMPIPQGGVEASALNSLPEMGETIVTSGGLLQIANRFLVTVAGDGLLLVDRYRAHVKVLYERFIGNADSAVGKTQQVMFGEVLELSPAQKAVIDSVMPQIQALGYELDLSKAPEEGVFRCGIIGIPAVLGNNSPSDALLKLIDEAAREGEISGQEIFGRLALSLAQSAAMRANRVLKPDEAERLLADLFALPDPTYTPDGHRIISQLTMTELSRRFG